MISPKEIDNLANLSRIKLTDEDKISFVKEFDSILNYIDQLKNVKVNIDTEARVGAVKNITREDMVKSTSIEDRERMLHEVPDREGDFVAVKKIISQ